jgi:CO/xanthine dehydrogenase FAD-binding subunit
VRAAISKLQVARPANLEEALRQLRRKSGGERWMPLAGGTDVFVYLNAGTLDQHRFMDISRLRELRGIREGADGLRIGAGVTFAEVRRHPLICKRFPALALAASEVGAAQIQHRATIAGNIANASPAGDSLPVLLAYDAYVRVRSLRGIRPIRFERFYTGYREFDCAHDELIVDVILPFPQPRVFSFFRKVGTRRAQSISKVVFAGTIRLDRGGIVDHVRLAFGSVAPVPQRAYEAEQVLLGRTLSSKAASAALEALPHDIAPIDDIRSDRGYRHAIAANVTGQFLRAAGARFGVS